MDLRLIGKLRDFSRYSSWGAADGSSLSAVRRLGHVFEDVAYKLPYLQVAVFGV